MGGRRALRTPKEKEKLSLGLLERGLLNAVREICRKYNVTLEDVLVGRANTRVVRARDACAWMLLEKGFSSNEAGLLLGMDHTSILAARGRYKKRDMGRLIT